MTIIENKIFRIGKGLTLQDLIDYANEHGFNPSEMEIKIEDIDTAHLYPAIMEHDEIFEPMIVLY